jgi:endonuclease G
MIFQKNSIFILLFSVLILSACREIVNPDDLNKVSHLALGNPSGATTNLNNPQNYLLIKPQFALSYHRDKGGANWVSWHLSKNWQGNIDRQDDFRTDLDLPASWYRVSAADYSGTGFDRGHLCPSADRTRSQEDNSATFVMSNMLPQAPDNNRGPWAELESYCRSIINTGAWELYIIAGGSGTNGLGSNGFRQSLQNGKINVPASFWKVILILPLGDNDLKRVDANVKTLAVIMPNRQGIKNQAWQSYQVTVDEVEALTGYDFFSEVPESIQKVIERQLDIQ